MRSLVRWCLNRTSVVLLATLLVVGAGAFGATKLRQQLFPDITFPFLIATIPVDGMSADSIDRDVSTPLAAATKTVESAGTVTTVSQSGAARLYVELDYGTDIAKGRQEMLDKMQAVQLPEGAGEVEIEGGFNSQASVVATLRAPDGDLSKITPRARKLKSDLEKVKGVSRVELAGSVGTQLDVQLSPAAIQQGFTPPAVAALIRGAQSTAAAGAVNDRGQALPLVVTGAGIKDGSQLGALPLPGGTPLGSLAKVRSIEDPTAGYSRTNGKPSIAVSVYRSTNANEVDVVDATMEELDDVKSDIGASNVTVITDTATEIRKSIQGLIIESGLGALFAVIVIFIFLRSIRSTLIAAVSIPTSLVFGLLVAWALGLTLDIITLAGLTIAIGRVIDDGIVVIENINKHLERGEDRRTAVLDGTNEVAVAIASSTIATAAVFLPIGLVGGFISEIFYSFSIIVSVALLASLVVATTVIPVLAGLLLKPYSEPLTTESRLSRAVTPATRFGLRHRWVVIGVALLTFAATIGIVGSGAIPTQFMPDTGTQRAYGTITLPPGTTTEQAAKSLKPINDWLEADDGIDDYQVAYGAATQMLDFNQTPSTATFFLNLKDSTDVDKLVTGLRARGEKAYPNSFTVQQLENGPPTGSFQATITGKNQADLIAASKQVQDLLEKRDDVVEISNNAAVAQPQLNLAIKPGAATPAQVQGMIASLSMTAPAGTAANGSTIAVHADPMLLANVDALRRLPLAVAGATSPTPTMALVQSTRAATAPTLGDVATLKRSSQPSFIVRTKGELSATVKARMLGEDTRKTITEVQGDIKDLKLEGAKVSYDQGDAQFISEMFQDLGLAMLTAIVLVYLVLVVFFGSIAQPLTILAPVLFSTIGSLLALAITGSPLGLPAMIGQLLLIGIVVSNSILLVDTAINMRRGGMDRNEALIQAARLRVRPVLMTAMATIAALLPLALGISGEGGIISKSLGTVVIGGLLVATLLTLVIVPAVFTLFDRTGRRPGDTPAPPTPKAARGANGKVAAGVVKAPRAGE